MATSPETIAKIVALRELGQTTAKIAETTGISERTVKRICHGHDVKKGSLLEAARREVTSSIVGDICNDSHLKGLVTALVDRVLVHGAETQNRLRLAASRTGEISTLDEYLKLARAESASALALKANVDTVRSLLAFGGRISPIDELPVLTIRRLTAEEVDEIRKEQEEQERALGLDVPSVGEAPDQDGPSPDDDVVIEVNDAPPADVSA